MSQHPPASLITNCQVYFLLFLVNLCLVELLILGSNDLKTVDIATVNLVAACSSSAAFKKLLFADKLITYISYYSIVYIPYFLYLAPWGLIFSPALLDWGLLDGGAKWKLGA